MNTRRTTSPLTVLVWLRRLFDKPLLRHPTGLTWHAKWGEFLGDSVEGKAVIYRFDWNKAWEDGNLDRAVLILLLMTDDAAVNGCRPEFVTLDGKDYLATADYGEVRPEVRLYDPDKMLKTKRTSAPGVTAFRILVRAPFNSKPAALGYGAFYELTCVQNVIARPRLAPRRALELQAKVACRRPEHRGQGCACPCRLSRRKMSWKVTVQLAEGNRGLFVTSMLKDSSLSLVRCSSQKCL